MKKKRNSAETTDNWLPGNKGEDICPSCGSKKVYEAYNDVDDGICGTQLKCCVCGTQGPVALC
jgi:uncharacterized protein (DUF983 family)